MKSKQFSPGDIARLNEPSLGLRGDWRYIILSSPIFHEASGTNQYDAYCFRAPNYRNESLGKIHRIIEHHLVLIESK